MKSKLNIFSSFSSALILASVLSACGGNKKEETPNIDRLPEDVKPVAAAIIKDSPEEFAAAMNYPIERPYPLRDVEDSAQMVKYYSTLVDDSLKAKVKESPDSLWSQDGWRGWTLDNGSYMWIDEKKVYSINYVSLRENQMLDSLRKEEISTLDPSLRKGWVPMICIVDSIDGVIFRIDSEQDASPVKLRLAGYEKNTHLSHRPALLLYGSVVTEGTMENRFFHFSDSIGNSADYMPDALDEDTIPVMEVRHKGRFKRYKVKPGYWLDYTKARNIPDSVSATITEFSSDSLPSDVSMVTEIP